MSSGADLAARVAALEAQLQALTEQAQSDTLSPNYLTVNPDGTVGATFTGLIKALGLELPAGAGTPGPQNTITWQRTSDGAQVAQLVSVESPGPVEDLYLTVFTPSVAQQAEIHMQAEPTFAAVSAQALGPGGVHSVVLVDDSHRSSFLQLNGGSANFHVAWGTQAVSWASGAVDATPVAVTHGLNATPQVVLLTQEAGGLGGEQFTFVVGSLTFFQFTINASQSVAGATTQNVIWLAIG